MKRDFIKKIQLVASVVSSGLIPVAILGVSFTINYITNILGLSGDLPSGIVMYLGGISSVFFYSYLVYSDIRAFVKEEDGEYAIRSLEIDKEVEERKIEYQKIIKVSRNIEENQQTPQEIQLKFESMTADNMDSEYIIRTIINASKQIAIAKNIDLSLITIDESVLIETVFSGNVDIKRFGNLHNRCTISDHRKAGIFTYWMSKMKPLKAVGEIEEINEIVAIKVGLSIIGKTEEALKDYKLYKNFIYHLRYRNLDSDCMSLIYQSLQGQNDEND